MTLAVPLLPSLVAVMVTGPGDTAETKPVDETVAIAVFELAHATVRPVRGAPFASFGVAVNCTVWPTTTPAVAGVMSTVATGGTVTVTVAVPLLPSLVAVIVTVPAATPLTSPVHETVATAVFELAHVTVRPVTGAPFASFGVAVNCTV